jgi:hypothetical protein
MAKGKSVQNNGILEYALHHLEKELAELQEKIDHVKSQLGVKSAAPKAAAVAPAAAAPAAGGKKRVLSAAARKRIAAAQRKRWAEHRKSLKATKKAA